MYRANEAELERTAAATDLCQAAIIRDDADELQRLLRRLPEAQQEVIVLAFYGQLSHAEIAVKLGLPAGTVTGRMRLGLRKLRRSSQETPG